MRVARIDIALEGCEDHLTATESFGTDIERLLTYSLLVVIYAEFEQLFKSIIQQRCDSIEDNSLRELVRTCVGNVSRIQTSEIGDLLGRFGAERKAAFRSEIESTQDNQRAETFYNNLISNRHYTAHSMGSNLTFEEVKKFYLEGHVVFDFFKDTLMAINGHSPTV